MQYTAAVKASTLEPTAKAMAALGSLTTRDPKLGQILATPTLADKDKADIVAELKKQVGSADATVGTFLAVLAENNRLGLLPGVCNKFGELMSAARGEVEMTVTSAQVRGGMESRMETMNRNTVELLAVCLVRYRELTVHITNL